MKSALLSLILVIAPLFGASAAEVIKVPFNFQWGESSERLEDGMAKVKARIVERRNVQNRKCIVVEGIPQRLLIRALFYFDSDALNEIELQYGDPSWDSSQFTNFFDQTRRNIESKYGPGRMIAQQKSSDGTTQQGLLGYQWVQQTTSLSLFYFTAQQGAEAFRMLSLHYKGF
jgi:hypothetical protein